jgi:hypothetical protein
MIRILSLYSLYRRRQAEKRLQRMVEANRCTFAAQDHVKRRNAALSPERREHIARLLAGYVRPRKGAV